MHFLSKNRLSKKYFDFSTVQISNSEVFRVIFPINLTKKNFITQVVFC